MHQKTAMNTSRTPMRNGPNSYQLDRRGICTQERWIVNWQRWECIDRVPNGHRRRLNRLAMVPGPDPEPCMCSAETFLEQLDASDAPPSSCQKTQHLDDVCFLFGALALQDALDTNPTARRRPNRCVRASPDACRFPRLQQQSEQRFSSRHRCGGP